MSATNAAIGSLQFIGDDTPIVLPISTKLRSIEREGIDGEELVNTGKRGTPAIWTTWQDANDGAATATAINALDGTLQTITNIDGSTVGTVRVELLSPPKFKRVLKCVGGLTSGTATCVVAAQWRLTPTV